MVDIIIAPNKRIEERINNCGFSDTVLIEHFVPDEYTSKQDDNMEEGRILCIGRLTKDKGFQYVIEAFYRLVGIFSKARLDICGNGPFRKDSEKLVEDLNLSGVVIFHGFVPMMIWKHIIRDQMLLFFLRPGKFVGW